MMVGIVEVRGANLFTTLNNVCVYSMNSDQYSAHFGFAVEEIRYFVKDQEMLSTIIEWYNGYRVGGITVINPWSFVNFLSQNDARSYWIDTAFTATIRSIPEPRLKEILLPTFKLLFGPDPIAVPLLCCKFDYSSRSSTVVSVLHFLIHIGYLTYALFAFRTMKCANIGMSMLSTWCVIQYSPMYRNCRHVCTNRLYPCRSLLSIWKVS